MAKELNIAAILNEKPKYTRLWSPLYGEVFYNRLAEGGGIRVLCKGLDGSLGHDEKGFWQNGKFTLSGEVCLFPSKAMRDWGKFAWKKGDVLFYNGYRLVFDKWLNNDYTIFNARHLISCSDGYYSDPLNNRYCCFEKLMTKDWRKATEPETESYMKALEKESGSKLNLSTLEFDKQPEFKDGDIVFVNCVQYGDLDSMIFISNGESSNRIFHYAAMCPNTGDTFIDGGTLIEKKYVKSMRKATDSEKQQLFEALAKEGKRWNEETMTLEDLPKKCEFKPMDWCLMRDHGDRRWELCQFGFYISEEDSEEGVDYYPYCAVGGHWFHDCIPYNDQTKHLLGTTDEWKGGEG